MSDETLGEEIGRGNKDMCRNLCVVVANINRLLDRGTPFRSKTVLITTSLDSSVTEFAYKENGSFVERTKTEDGGYGYVIGGKIIRKESLERTPLCTTYRKELCIYSDGNGQVIGYNCRLWNSGYPVKDRDSDEQPGCVLVSEVVVKEFEDVVTELSRLCEYDTSSHFSAN